MTIFPHRSKLFVNCCEIIAASVFANEVGPVPVVVVVVDVVPKPVFALAVAAVVPKPVFALAVAVVAVAVAVVPVVPVVPVDVYVRISYRHIGHSALRSNHLMISFEKMCLQPCNWMTSVVAAKSRCDIGHDKLSGSSICAKVMHFITDITWTSVGVGIVIVFSGAKS